MVLARQMYKVVPEELTDAIADGRLLIVSTTTAIRQSKATALARNRYICEMADKILFIGVTAQSSLYALSQEFNNKSSSSSIRSALLK